MKCDAIIPAWNEAATIGAIVQVFTDHPDICHTLVCVDAKTNDDTAKVAKTHYATVIANETMVGKGQVVAEGLRHVDTPRVVFCDADITGLTAAHVSGLIYPYVGMPMVVGVPDFPAWETIPRSFARRRFMTSWPWVSGERCVPTDIARTVPLFGYLMETQLNRAVYEHGRRTVFQRLVGVKSELDLNEQRLADMHRHLEVGKRLGYV